MYSYIEVNYGQVKQVREVGYCVWEPLSFTYLWSAVWSPFYSFKLVLYSAPQITAEDSDQMVAFLCNRPSMYKTADGWLKDDTVDCLNDPEDILDYCRKVRQLYRVQCS